MFLVRVGAIIALVAGAAVADPVDSGPPTKPSGAEASEHMLFLDAPGIGFSLGVTP